MALTIPVKVVKIGNSLRVTIPKPIVDALNIKEGDTVDVGVNENIISMKRRKELL